MFINSLWISGAATVVAILSYVDWRASTQSEGLRIVLKDMARSPGFALGMFLICLGAGLGVLHWGERILWFLLAAGFAFRAGRTWFSARKERTS